MKTIEQERDAAADAALEKQVLNSGSGFLEKPYKGRYRYHDGHCDGFDHAVRVLAERGPEFDRELALVTIIEKAYTEFGEHNYVPINFDLEIARWQFDRDKAMIAARDEVISRLQEQCRKFHDNEITLKYEIKDRDSEIERLRAGLERIAKGIVPEWSDKTPFYVNAHTLREWAREALTRPNALDEILKQNKTNKGERNG